VKIVPPFTDSQFSNGVNMKDHTGSSIADYYDSHPNEWSEDEVQMVIAHELILIRVALQSLVSRCQLNVNEEYNG